MIPLTLVFVTEAHQPRRMHCSGVPAEKVTRLPAGLAIRGRSWVVLG